MNNPTTRRVLLAAPRGFCAGVDRAVLVVEEALRRHGPPVYVRRQIVHNLHVVRDLEERGAVFVAELDEVPAGSVVVFSAHGVSPAVRAQAAERGLAVLDATCPLVARVHAEARRFAAHDHLVVLIGHEEHDEVQGTVGEAPDRIVVVADAEDVAALDVPVGQRISYLAQTTLAVDDDERIASALRARFPQATGSGKDDICYASQNRQDAVKAIAGDLVLVIGSQNSSNSKRLVEVALRTGTGAAHLIEDAGHIDPQWLDGVSTVGVTSGASAPEHLVREVLAWLADHGFGQVDEIEVTVETEYFALPSALR